MRLADDVYASDVPIHLTICAASGRPFAAAGTARMVCASLERTCETLQYDLLAYCLMPDHLHVLLSPADSETPIAVFLRRFKSFTTREHQKICGQPRLWQFSARDRVIRPAEDVMRLATYIAKNPVMHELVDCWSNWPYTKVFV